MVAVAESVALILNSLLIAGAVRMLLITEDIKFEGRLGAILIGVCAALNVALIWNGWTQ